MTGADDWSRDWPAPAKLNLFLHVVGRRADGYHLLQTVFRFVDFCDGLRFSPRGDGEVALGRPLPGVDPDRHLCVRAARRLREAAGLSAGVTIDLEKRLPMGGGLGGGSSDAATTLIALNRLWGCGLDSTRLQCLALELGADVPVFIHGRTAFAEGVGERFTDVTAPPAWYLVVAPDVHVPTPDIFRDPMLRRDAPPVAPADWRPGFGGNDLEPVACRLFPGVGRILAELRERGLAARMSGSGACCFAEFSDAPAAEAARADLPAGTRAFVARGLDRHPLFGLTREG